MTNDRGARTVAEWEREVAPLSAAMADIRTMATHGNVAARVIVKIDDAMRAKKHAERWGEEVPAWARETLSFLDCYQNDEDNLDEAVAALSRALA
jgi:hypothetical protein